MRSPEGIRSMLASQGADGDDWIPAGRARTPTALPGPAGHSSSACRVLLVCESALFRHVVVRLLAGDARFEIVGNVRSGSDVLPILDKLRPHAILFDEEIAEVKMKATLCRMRERHARVGAVSCRPLEERCSVAVLGSDALPDGIERGAMSVAADGRERSDFSSEVRTTLMRACGFVPRGAAGLAVSSGARGGTYGGPGIEAFATGHTGVSSVSRSGPQVLVIGSSTGGPSALTNLLPALPADFPLPVLIVQHMPAHFTKLLAERLARVSRIPVMEAQEGMPVSPGVALLAPGNFHMRLARTLHGVEVRLTQDELENSCRPAVDVLFRSVAEVYSGRVIATVLTGMGQDGLKGVRVLKQRSTPVLVQDRETSVVWGMPGAIAGAGLADSILPLEQIAPAILRLL